LDRHFLHRLVGVLAAASHNQKQQQDNSQID
jgi:hypothetical protein